MVMVVDLVDITIDMIQCKVSLVWT